MRYILDTYIRAEDSTIVSELGSMSLVELLLQGKTTTPSDLIHDIPGDQKAKAETIENNLKHEIVKKILTRSEVYSGVYGRASISFYAFNSNGNRGIACGLNNLQKIRDGEPLGGRASAESDFADDDEDFLS